MQAGETSGISLICAGSVTASGTPPPPPPLLYEFLQPASRVPDDEQSVQMALAAGLGPALGADVAEVARHDIAVRSRIDRRARVCVVAFAAAARALPVLAATALRLLQMPDRTSNGSFVNFSASIAALGNLDEQARLPLKQTLLLLPGAAAAAAAAAAAV